MVARTEAEVVMDTMLEHWDGLQLVEEPKFRLNNTLRSFESLPVQVG